ncbi:S-layer homology domain-containing protein [Cohnella cellulosilytica]|uniref:S-layer homology domain-containing protein n=1 Tax=Cohnella cellulosilytica TaxID=986710 RepID=UPI00362220FB
METGGLKVRRHIQSLVLYLLADDGTKLAGQIAQLTVDESNAAKVTLADIAPYGTATDALTNKPLQGVKVSVYWADTKLNRSMGRKPNTRVELPRVQGMANRNTNLQSTATDGQFGWLLPPDGDYYVIAEKEGYKTYDGHGSILHVGKTAVKLNFALQAKVLEKGGLKAFVSGYPNGTFRPNAGVTRAELASMLLKALGLQPRASAVEYSDVPDTNWAAGAIAH